MKHMILETTSTNDMAIKLDSMYKQGWRREGELKVIAVGEGMGQRLKYVQLLTKSKWKNLS